MSTITSLRRAFTTSGKQIRRGGWLSTASILIMTLAFLVLNIFGFMAYVSELFLKSLENSPHIYVFFNIGTEESEINKLKNELESKDNIDFIEYTSEEQAKDEFAAFHKANDNPLIAAEIENEERSFPASLGIRLFSIKDAEEIINLVEHEKETNSTIYDVGYSDVTINNIKDAVFWLRLIGGSIMSLLIVVVFFFTLLTVEFRTYSRSKEIEIMQLVGGSLWYIRLPFILEGAFYGIMGSAIANTILFGVYSFGWYSQATKPTKSFLVGLFWDLDWSAVNFTNILIYILINLVAGFILGAINSLISIIRYIK